MFKSILSGLSTVLLLFGCAGLPAETETVSKKLEGKEWKLVSFGQSRMAVPSRATLLLKDGYYSGWAGCNAMGGKYVLRGDNLIFTGKLTFKGGVSTMMACSDMALESRYHEAMGKVDRYKVEGNRLILLHGDHSVLNFVTK